jgi:F-type H+-transporting ATPase subunit b
MVRRPDRPRKFLVFFVMVIVGCVLLSGFALAAGEEGHGQDRSGDLKDLLYRFMNFALLVIILFVALKKVGIKQFFLSRTEEIKKKLEELRRGKEQAEQKYRDLEKRLQDFEGKKREIIEQFKAEGRAEKEKIVDEARSRVNQILEQAEATVQQEIQAARDRLKAEVLTLATRQAEEIIAREMTEKDQDRLVDDFIERVGKGH